MRFRLLLFVCLLSITASANNMLVQNVTTLNNDAVNKTIQVQFDISWDNSWRDSINYDAAWIFIKFKDANGLWQHAQLNQTGFNLGTGTADSIKITSDKVGTWVYRSGLGSGTFNVTGMQLQWNYGLSGLNSVIGLEVRVFAVEMVYVPEGGFNVAKTFNVPPFGLTNTYPNSSFYANGNNFPVINNKMSPTLTYNDGTTAVLRIKGDVGLDTNNDDIVDNTSYPTGFNAFFEFKYELTEQQFADLLNTLIPIQVTNLGLAGLNITFSNGQFNSSTPNKACGNSNTNRLFAYADWSGLRPMSILEFNKSSYGPSQPNWVESCYSASCPYGGGTGGVRGYFTGGGCQTCFYTTGSYGVVELFDVSANSTQSSSREESGSSYYGLVGLTGNAFEPVIKMNSYAYVPINGNGLLAPNGFSDVPNCSFDMIIYIDQLGGQFGTVNRGFRYVRSAE